MPLGVAFVDRDAMPDERLHPHQVAPVGRQVQGLARGDEARHLVAGPNGADPARLPLHEADQMVTPQAAGVLDGRPLGRPQRRAGPLVQQEPDHGRVVAKDGYVEGALESRQLHFEPPLVALVAVAGLDQDVDPGAPADQVADYLQVVVPDGVVESRGGVAAAPGILAPAVDITPVLDDPLDVDQVTFGHGIEEDGVQVVFHQVVVVLYIIGLSRLGDPDMTGAGNLGKKGRPAGPAPVTFPASDVPGLAGIEVEGLPSPLFPVVPLG